MLIVCGGLGLLVFFFFLSMTVGAKDITNRTIWDAILHNGPDTLQHKIVRELRLSRTVMAVIAGASFAVAGAMMQGMTRNALASPDLIGVNAGATFALAIVLSFFPLMPFRSVIVCAMIGAGLGVALVYGISAIVRGGLTPLRLALAGAAVSALLTALSQGIAIYAKVAKDMAFWSAGGIANVKWFQIDMMLPFAVVGIAAALLLAPAITILSLGEDVATGLGMRKGWIKLAGNVVVLLLAGASVAVVGPIGFVGLVVPHIMRAVLSVDYRWIIPASAIYGALLTLAADIVGRVLNPPNETPLGIITAIIGVPFFVYLCRSGKRDLS